MSIKINDAWRGIVRLTSDWDSGLFMRDAPAPSPPTSTAPSSGQIFSNVRFNEQGDTLGMSYTPTIVSSVVVTESYLSQWSGVSSFMAIGYADPQRRRPIPAPKEPPRLAPILPTEAVPRAITLDDEVSEK